MAQIALIVVNPEAGFTTKMLQELVTLGYAVHGVADPMQPETAHSYGWVVDGPSTDAPESPASTALTMPPLTHGNPFDEPTPSAPMNPFTGRTSPLGNDPVPLASAPVIAEPPVEEAKSLGPLAIDHPTPWTDPERIAYLTPNEAGMVANLLAYPQHVIDAYKDGTAIGLTRIDFPPDLIARASKAWAAVVHGKRTLPAARTWFQGEVEEFRKRAPAAPSTQTGLPGVESAESQLIALLNKQKYLREIVGELLERGFPDRNSVVRYCESVQEKVPLLKMQGASLAARIDASFAAIGR